METGRVRGSGEGAINYNNGTSVGLLDKEAPLHDLKISPVEELAGYSGKVVLETHDDMQIRVNLLKELGIPLERISVLM